MSLPRVSLFVFCYQQAEFIERAVLAALAQDYANLQIILSDDCSRDASFEIMQRITASYSGPHTVTLNRNLNNLGIGAHFVHIMTQLADGDLVVASAGDDICAENRVSRIVEEWLQQNKPAVVAHALAEIDELGNPLQGSRTTQYRLQPQPDKWPTALAIIEYVQHTFPLPYIGAALAYRKDLFSDFGSPAAEPAYEDHLMYFRAMLQGGLHYFPEKLVQYRRHSNNFTAKAGSSASKTLPIPALFKGLLADNTVFATDKVGLFRLHQLSTQQWLDYSAAVRRQYVSADVFVVSALWQQVSWRHRRLLKMVHTRVAYWQLWRYHLTAARCMVHSAFGKYHYLRPERALAIAYVAPLKTVVFGAGSGGEKAIANLSGGFQIIALCDNNQTLHGKTVAGLPVWSPQQLSDQIANIDCVVIASTYFYEIKAQLLDQHHIPDAKICRAPYTMITQPPAAVTETTLLVLLTAMLCSFLSVLVAVLG